MEALREGEAKFFASVNKSGKISKELEIFYNPAMKFNRDVSILVMNALGLKNISIADIMAGSGVRSLRFLKELNPHTLESISVNDYSAGFEKTFRKNLEASDIIHDKGKISIANKDANIFLLESSGFDYIDIDPFGSPNDFLEAAVRRISRKGTLAVTATDTAPLSGTYPNACVRKYWAKPLRNHMMHEIGLRILIRKIQLIGASHDKAMVPIYSFFKDHYFRIFFECMKGKSKVDELIRQHKYLLYCSSCMNCSISDVNDGKCNCVNASDAMDYAGPLWTGALCDYDLAQEISRTNNNDSNANFLTTIMDESRLGIVGFYDIHALAKKYKLKIPTSTMLMNALSATHFLASRTTFSPLGIKTNAPLQKLIDAMKSGASKK